MSGIYTGAMGMLAYQTKLNITANNIANVQTNGYKADDTTFRVFEETYMIARSGADKVTIGNYQHMVYPDDIQTDFTSGLYKTTNSSLDLAIVDDADATRKTFFVVSENGQEYLTRNGQFTLDADRRLSTYGGELVLGTNGNPITIPENVSFSVNKEGAVNVTGQDAPIGTIRTVSVDEENLVFLQKERGSLFSVMTRQDIDNIFGNLGEMLAEFDQNITYQKVFGSDETLRAIWETGEVNILNEGEGVVQSSMLEGSNVELSTELVTLMQTQRGFQASQNVWKTMSDIMEIEATRIGQ